MKITAVWIIDERGGNILNAFKDFHIENGSRYGIDRLKCPDFEKDETFLRSKTKQQVTQGLLSQIAEEYMKNTMTRERIPSAIKTLVLKMAQDKAKIWHWPAYLFRV